MSLSNTIPTINILPPSSLKYTPNPTYKYHVEIQGTGVDACWVKMPRNKAVRFKSLDEAGLRQLLRSFKDFWINEDDLVTKVAKWVQKAEYQCHLGVDITEPFEMTVFDDDENIVYVHDHKKYEMFVLPGSESVPVHDNEASYLYAKDECPVHLRYTIMTHKPFDPMLIALDSTILFENLILQDFRYDGTNINPKRLENFWYDLRQDIKIIYN